MSKKLQAILPETECREIQKMPRSRDMTIAEWVGQALALAISRQPSADIGKKH
jgi:hypothetical protein